MGKIDNQWYKDRWESIPEERRREIVAHLRAYLTIDDQAAIVKTISEQGTMTWTGAHHHGWGTGVRNHLRKLMKDDELPSAPYPDGRGEYKNWDDYYVQAIEAAVLVVTSAATPARADGLAVTSSADDALPSGVTPSTAQLYGEEE